MNVDKKLSNVSLGRKEDIEKIDKLIDEFNPQIIQISGCPGTGKTTLANKLKKARKNKYFNYDDIRNKHIKIFDKNITIIPKYVLFILKNLSLHHTILKNTRKNKVSNLLTFSYYVFIFDLELQTNTSKSLLRDEPLFQLFFNRKYHHMNDIENLEEIIDVLNKMYYSKLNVLNIHLTENDDNSIIRKRQKRDKILVDENKCKDTLRQEITFYKENIGTYREQVELTNLVDIEVITQEENTRT